jgi:ribonuclease HI
MVEKKFKIPEIYVKNPYAIYVHCDGAMNYGSKSRGGIGIEIEFPESIQSENISMSLGSYQYANIERIELEAIYQGIQRIQSLYLDEPDKFTNVSEIIITTDRASLIERTNPYTIQKWRSNQNKGHTHEGKAVKNFDLLEKIDKARAKLNKLTHCSVTIEYARRKHNKKADGLARKGKMNLLVENDISIKGTKIGKRIYDDCEIDYKHLRKGDQLHVRVFKKEPVMEQWEIMVEVCEGRFLGKKIRIYSDSEQESFLHRHHEYLIKLVDIFTHHLTIERDFQEILKPESK